MSNNHVHITELSDSVRVAVVIEAGKIMPRWFVMLDRPAAERVQVKEICYRWSHHEGAAKVLNFSVSDGANTYRLSLDTSDFSWKLGIAE